MKIFDQGFWSMFQIFFEKKDRDYGWNRFVRLLNKDNGSCLIWLVMGETIARKFAG